MKCAVCGKASHHPVLTSTNSFGYPDLDLRPPAMQRNTMNTWIYECPHCGYVSSDLEKPLEISEDFLKCESYMTCEGHDFKSDLAGLFYKAYLISKKQNELQGEFYNLLYCAWVCDDADDELAVDVRITATDVISMLIEADSKDRENFIVMKSDLMRRSGKFDEMIMEYENVYFENELLNDIITFQIKKAVENDDGCYTIEDVKGGNL